MNKKQPLNNSQYGRPVRGRVIITAAPQLADYVGLATILSDLDVCAKRMRKIRTLTERLIAEIRFATAEEMESANDTWSAAVSAYGRCFTNAKGRRVLTLDDVERFEGDAEIHTALMEDRHASIAHATVSERLIEIFAKLRLEPDPPGVVEIDVLESMLEFPELEELRRIEHHLASMYRGLRQKMHETGARIVEGLNRDHLKELYECERQRKNWL